MNAATAEVLPRMQSTPLLPGLARYRISLFCGTAGHPKRIAEARGERGLERAERSYRCPTCGRPNLP